GWRLTTRVWVDDIRLTRLVVGPTVKASMVDDPTTVRAVFLPLATSSQDGEPLTTSRSTSTAARSRHHPAISSASAVWCPYMSRAWDGSIKASATGSRTWTSFKSHPVASATRRAL